MTKTITITDEKLYRQFKKECVLRDISMSGVFQECIAKFVQSIQEGKSDFTYTIRSEQDDR